MMRFTTRMGVVLLTTGLTLALAGGDVLGQPGGQGHRGGGRQMPKMFGEDAIDVGAPLPDVEVFSDTGKTFNTSQLKGKYTVIVFGCLT